MKYINLRLTLFSFIFVCSLFISQPVLASQQDFILTTPDSSEVGQGQYEDLPDGVGKVIIKIQGHEYTGTGAVSKRAIRPKIKELRADRALMAMPHKKHVLAELVATDGLKLTCELNLKYSDIWGQCIHPNSETLTIKTIREE